MRAHFKLCVGLCLHFGELNYFEFLAKFVYLTLLIPRTSTVGAVGESQTAIQRLRLILNVLQAVALSKAISKWFEEDRPKKRVALTGQQKLLDARHQYSSNEFGNNCIH